MLRWTNWNPVKLGAKSGRGNGGYILRIISVIPKTANSMFTQTDNKKLSYRRRSESRVTPARTMSTKLLSIAAQLYVKITFGKACSKRMTLKATQGHQN